MCSKKLDISTPESIFMSKSENILREKVEILKFDDSEKIDCLVYFVPDMLIRKI
jgi:hypothetical protein